MTTRASQESGIAGRSPYPVEQMTARQRARRKALTDAVLELLLEVGVDGVQMKHVAQRSGVALGTTYRYFTSKDHLLAEAMADWQLQFTERQKRDRSRISLPPSERLARFVRRGSRQLARHPEVGDLMVHVLSSRDPYAATKVMQITEHLSDSICQLLSDIPSATVRDVASIVGAVWYYSVFTWTTGRCTFEEAVERNEVAVRLLLSPFDPPGTSA